MLLGGGLNIGHMTENRRLGVRRRVEVMIIRGTEERMGGTLQSRGIQLRTKYASLGSSKSYTGLESASGRKEEK